MEPLLAALFRASDALETLFGLLPVPLLAALCGAVGAIFGSFLNVLVYRLPRDQSLWRHGSRCPDCARAIRPWENIPVLSFLLLRGRCAGCRRPISRRYPLVETLSAGLFILPVCFRPATPWLLFDGAVLGLLLALALIDLDCRQLPDDLTLLLLAAAALAGNRPGGPGGPAAALWGLALGAGFPLVMRWVMSAAIGREALGLGDVKLLGALGALFGPAAVLIILMFASVLGVAAWLPVAAVYLAAWRRRKRAAGLPVGWPAARRAFRRARRLIELPFGTYIAAATLPVYLWGEPLLRWLGWTGPGGLL